MTDDIDLKRLTKADLALQVGKYREAYEGQCQQNKRLKEQVADLKSTRKLLRQSVHEAQQDRARLRGYIDRILEDDRQRQHRPRPPADVPDRVGPLGYDRGALVEDDYRVWNSSGSRDEPPPWFEA